MVSAMQDIGSRLALSPPPIGASIVLPDLRGDHAFPVEAP